MKNTIARASRWVIPVLIGIGLALYFSSASAGGLLPEGVEEFRNDCGQVCYVWPDGSGDCYPCLECAVIPPITPTKEPTPEPTKKPKCNQGRGNLDDGCSPGNSDRNHGPNDSQGGKRN